MGERGRHLAFKKMMGLNMNLQASMFAEWIKYLADIRFERQALEMQTAMDVLKRSRQRALDMWVNSAECGIVPECFTNWRRDTEKIRTKRLRQAKVVASVLRQIA